MAGIIIGLIIGFMMGLTGAGGALISIPLFQTFLDSTLKESTVLSLLTVILGATLSLGGRIREVDGKFVIVLVLSGTLANIMAFPIKAMMPEAWIILLLFLIGVFSIISVWRKPAPKTGERNFHPMKTILTGIVLGFITTFTGLGGGVLLIPVLLRFFGKTYEEALPTSLASILLVSLTSLGMQWETAARVLTLPQVFQIAGGAFLSIILLKIVLRRMTDQQTLKLRTVIFSVVTGVSILLIVVKSL